MSEYNEDDLIVEGDKLTRTEQKALQRAQATTKMMAQVAEEYGCGADFISRALEEGWSLDRFKREAVDHYVEHKEKEVSGPVGANFSHVAPASNAAVGYSLQRAMQVALGEHRGNCIEREINDDLRRHRPAAHGGLLIPTYGVEIARDDLSETPLTDGGTIIVLTSKPTGN